MPIQFKEENHGKLLVLHLIGNLVKSDYETLIPEFERLVRREVRVRVLIDMTKYQSLAAGAWWEEIKFDFKHFSDIERLAVVGDKKWQHTMATLSQPLTQAEVRYFDVSDTAEARQWLTEP
jgi:hypothetical protein